MNGDPPGVWSCVPVTNGSCSNDRSYDGMLYVLTRRDRLGMQMRPDLAAVLPGQLRDAVATSATVKIEHKRFGVWSPFPYATLTASAARELATDIEAATGAG